MSADGAIRIKGSYTTKRDAGLTYEYEGFCFPVDDRFLWRARVYQDGQLSATLHGQLDPGSATRDALATAIAVKIEGLGT